MRGSAADGRGYEASLYISTRSSLLAASEAAEAGEGREASEPAERRGGGANAEAPLLHRLLPHHPSQAEAEAAATSATSCPSTIVPLDSLVGEAPAQRRRGLDGEGSEGGEGGGALARMWLDTLTRSGGTGRAWLAAPGAPPMLQPIG